MQATMLLADYAAEVQSKLYITGGGWSRVPAGIIPNMALAIKIDVPWDQANTPLTIVVTLVDSDGNPVNDPDGDPVRAEGKLEVGRPPGLAHGTPLDAPMALNVGGIEVAAGRYRWELEIDGEAVASVGFEAVAGGNV